MITRAGVAKRLGKSIATVRRMEGVELHATVDSRGVHLFDVREVDAIAAVDRRGARHRVGLDASAYCAVHTLQHHPDHSLDSSAERDDPPEELRYDAAYAEFRSWVDRARIDAMAIHEERSRLEGLRLDEVAATRKASRELRAAQRRLIAELEDADDCVLRRLTAANLDEILALLEAE